MSIDPNHLDLTTTNQTLIAMQRKYCHVGECPVSWQVIAYRPTLIGNTIYVLCFMVLLGLQSWFGIRYKTWTFLGSMIMGLLLEIIGYIGRLLLHSNPFINNYFLIYLICLTIGPAFFTACIYLCLGRIIAVVGPEYSRLGPRIYQRIFIGCDFLALVLQAAGGAIASTAKDHRGSQSGTNIMIGGLISQVISIMLFLCLWFDFDRHVRKAARNGTLGRNQGPSYASLARSQKFQFFQYALAIATVLILVRSTYRVAELAGGFNGTIANNQAAFMILEGPLIIIAISLLTFYHPGRVFGDLWAAAKQGVESTKLMSDPGMGMEMGAGGRRGKYEPLRDAQEPV